MSVFIEAAGTGDSFKKRMLDELAGGDIETAKDLYGISVKEEVDSALRFFTDELFDEMIHEFDVNGENRDSDDNEELDAEEGNPDGEAEENKGEQPEPQTEPEPEENAEEPDNDEDFELPEDEEEQEDDNTPSDEDGANGDNAPEEEENDEDFNMDGENEEGEDTPDDDTSEADTDADDSSDDSSKLKDLETVAFAELNEAEKEAKIKELKGIYINIYDKCKTLSDKTNDIKKDDSTIQIIEYINNSLTDLRQYILDYIETIFDSKTYPENIAQVQKYIAVLTSIKTIFAELKKDFVE